MAETDTNTVPLKSDTIASNDLPIDLLTATPSDNVEQKQRTFDQTCCESKSPGQSKATSSDTRYISPEEKWILWENADKVPGDSMVVRCNGCLCPLRTGLYEETPRSGCALTDRELEEFRSKPSSKRPPWQAVTNCDGASTREVYREMSVEQAKSGMEEPFVYAPFSEAELSVEAWKLAHQLACDFVEATQAYSKLWRKDDDTV